MLALVAGRDPRQTALHALRPGIPIRTLVNAYVLPSLKELGLYEGSLGNGALTRFGTLVANESDDDRARELVARQLVALDTDRVGLIEWIAVPERPEKTRRELLDAFLRDSRVNEPASVRAALLDRLGKWLAYLDYFGVTTNGRLDQTSVGVDRRHVAALRGALGAVPSDAIVDASLLESYARASRRVGTRLYVPIELMREELGRTLEALGSVLTDAQIDEVIREAPRRLSGHSVTFSPFSGPRKGGMLVNGMNAGFVSVRPETSSGRSPGTKRKEGRGRGGKSEA